MNVSVLKKIAFSVFCIVMVSGYGQDQRIADSLKLIYDEGKTVGQARLDLLRDLAFHENRDNQLRVLYARELIQVAEQAEDPKYIYAGYFQLGNAQRLAGDPEVAISSYLKSLDVAEQIEDEDLKGHSLMAIADTYSSVEDRENAVEYYAKSIALLEESDNKENLGIVFFNLADELVKLKRYEEATDYLNKAEDIFINTGMDFGLIYIEGNRGVILGNSGDPVSGIEKLDSTITALKQYEDYYGSTDYTISKAGLLALQGKYDIAISTAKEALSVAVEKDLKMQRLDAYLAMHEIYLKEGSKDESLTALRNYYNYKDSTQSKGHVDEVVTLKYNMAQKQSEVDLKQAEVELLSEQKNNQRIVLWATGIVVLLLSALAFGMYRRNKYVQKTKKIIEEEQARSEELLLNILPKQTAEELKEKGKVAAKKFDSVSVLFTDFVGFTKFSEVLDPEKLVQSMDYYYAHFDTIMDRHGLEKIKTVGDSYMCAGGLPYKDPEHAVKIVNAAREIVAFVQQAKNDRDDADVRFAIRIGINSGPVVAGVVGTKKFAYDIWGDTVNVASRMESNSKAGKINISENTYRLVKDHFSCESRGEIAIKNHGKMKMYYVTAPLSAKEKKKKEKLASA